jgi:type VI secretion system protein ImpM
MSDFSIGCFGKLPIYPDFIRHNASNKEIVQLDQWIQEGIQFAKIKMGQPWADKFSNSNLWNFLFHCDDAGHFLLGVYLPSRDTGGRLYPFLIFLRVDRSIFQLPLYFAPLFFLTFLNGARDLVQDGWKGMDIKALLSAVANMDYHTTRDFNQIREAYTQYLRDHSSKEFWENIFGDFESPKKYLITRNLSDILAPLRQNHANKFGLSLKFPLITRDSDEDYDIPVWFDMISGFIRHEKTTPVFFWNRSPSENKPCMIASLNLPSSKNFLFLLSPDMESDYWYELASDNTREVERVSKILSKDQKALLDSESMSLADFMRKSETCFPLKG